MQYRTLGKTGLEVSEIGVGGAQFGIPNYMGDWDPFTDAAQKATSATIHRALDLGYNYFDTAPGYGDGRSEEMVGVALQGHRERAIIATKVSKGQWTPEGIRASVENSLRRLQVDVIDLIQFHGSWYREDDTRQIVHCGGLETFLQLKQEGKVRFVGFTTEGPSAGVEDLIATRAFDTMQVRYNIMYQHTHDPYWMYGSMPQAEARGMGIVTMRTLTSGIFQRWFAVAFPGVQVDLTRALLQFQLSNPLIDVALVGMRSAAEVETNADVADDTAGRIDLRQIHEHYPPAPGDGEA